MKTDRNFTLKLIYDYFNGEINNFELDERLPNSTDPLITNIAKTFWYFYDDTRKHIWLDFYDSEVKMIVSIWIYLLKNDLTWQQIEAELPSKYSGSHDWLNLLEKAQTNFWNGSNIFVVYMPPITLALLKKCIDFNQISFYLFPKFFIRKYLKKMTAIINKRNESDCQNEWEKNGYHYENTIKKIADSGLYTNKSIIKKLLPYDSKYFILTEEILQKEAYLFSRGKIDDHKVNQLFDKLQDIAIHPDEKMWNNREVMDVEKNDFVKIFPIDKSESSENHPKTPMLTETSRGAPGDKASSYVDSPTIKKLKYLD